LLAVIVLAGIVQLYCETKLDIFLPSRALQSEIEPGDFVAYEF